MQFIGMMASGRSRGLPKGWVASNRRLKGFVLFAGLPYVM